MMRALLISSTCLLSTGCGIAIQSAMGWRSTEISERYEARPVRVATVPAGAEVCRESSGGGCPALGLAPLTDEVDVRVEEVVLAPSTLGVWLGAGISLVVSVVTIGVAATSCEDGDGSCLAPLVLTGFGAGFSAAVDGMTGVLYGALATPTVESTTPLETPRVTYAARKAGYESARSEIVAPTEEEVVLRLEPLAEETATTLVDAARTQMIVAVLPIEAADDSLEWIDALTRRIRVDVTAAGIRTVEVAAQEQAVAEASCTAEDCDVEIGRMLAASHVLRGRVRRLQDRCVLAVELVDLAREVSVAAVGSRADCEDRAVVDKLASSLPRDLLTGFRTGTSAP